MPEKTELEGNQDAGGNGLSSQQPSQSQGQPSTDFATKQDVEEIRNLIRGLQKGTDKINSRVEKRVSEILSSTQIGRIAELAKANMTPAQIEQQLVLDEVVAERKAKAPEATPADNQESAVGKAEVQVRELASKLGLDANDKDVAAALSGNDLAAFVRVAASKLDSPSAGAEDQPPLTNRERQSEEPDISKINDSSALYKMASKGMRFRKKAG